MGHDLTGKIMIITGASSGIGAATALACARAGMDLVLNARRPERLTAVAEQVSRLGRAAEPVVGDVTADGLADRLLDAAESRFGRFDVVFANAGYGLNQAVHEMEEPALRRIFEVNVFAADRLLRASARRLLAQQRRGHLLMTSSCVAKFTLPYFAAYTATKAVQNHFCRAMRMELRPYGIEVSSIHPVTTRTEFFEQAARMSGRPVEEYSPADRLPRWFVQTPEQVAARIVACLRRPRAEVWCSHTIRLLAGAMTIWPGLMDIIARIRPRR